MTWPDNKHYVRDWCKHFLSGVPPGEGHLEKCDAPILAIGEAPGANENRRGIPFVGAAGHLLDRLLKEAGLSRSDLYLTNIVPFQPPAGNKFESIPHDFVETGSEVVRQKALVFSGKVVVALGARALAVLTGQNGIMKWRGSVQPFEAKWLVGTIHPAAILRQPLLSKTSVFDWKRIYEICENGWTPPSFKLLRTTGQDARLLKLGFARALACDIETVRETSRILCISFCSNERESYSVDCREGIPLSVKKLLESPIPKIFTNGLFDLYILQLNGVDVSAFNYDTSLMFHALDNNAGPVTAASSEHGKSIIRPYSLAYCASVFSPFTYWKDSGKDTGEGEHERGAQRNWDSFSDYNAKDSLGSYVIARNLLRRLREEKRLDFYKTHYQRLLYPLLDLSLRGLLFDRKAAQVRSKELSRQLVTLRGRLESLAGQPLRLIKVFKKEPKIKKGRADKLVISQGPGGSWIGERKSISPIILQRYLYSKPPEGLGLKKQTKQGKVTSDEVALRNLLLYVQRNNKGPVESTADFLKGLLDFRETEKTLAFLNSGAVDEDGRIRAAYGLNVQSGRLRSSGNPTGTGWNLQNLQRDIRHLFLPDTFEAGEESYFLELDYKQAEDLVVKAISYAVTKDERPLALINDVCSGTRDIHRALAATWTGKHPKDITYEERYVTKRCRHGINNGMRFKQMYRTLIKDGFILPLLAVDRIYRAINEAEPWVDAFHQAIRRTCMRHGGVATSWGWQLDLRTEMGRYIPAGMKDESYKRAYTFIEQSEVGVMMKQWGLLTYDEKVKPSFRAQLNMLVHDNVVLSVPESELYPVMEIMYNGLVRPRTFGIYHPTFCTCGACDKVPTCTITIPAEIKISKTLSCTCSACAKKKPLEFSSLPKRKAFQEELKKWKLESNPSTLTVSNVA